MSLTLHGGLLSHPVRIMDGVIFSHLLVHLGRAGSALLCGLSSRCGEWGSSLVAVCGSLAAVVSLAAEHGLEHTRASVVATPGLNKCGSQALEHRPSSCRTQA